MIFMGCTFSLQRSSDFLIISASAFITHTIGNLFSQQPALREDVQLLYNHESCLSLVSNFVSVFVTLSEAVHHCLSSKSKHRANHSSVREKHKV